MTIVVQSGVLRSAGSITTFDPLNKSSHIALSGGNLVATSNSGVSGVNVLSTVSYSSGKKYAEFTLTTKVSGADSDGIGICNTSFVVDGVFLGGDINSWAMFDDAKLYTQGADQGGGASFAQGDVIGIAVDIASTKVWWRVNAGAWTGSGDPASGTGGKDFSAMGSTIFVGIEGEGNGDVWTANFGASAYANAAPSGFGNW